MGLCSGQKNRYAWAPRCRGAFEGSTHTASFLARVLDQQAHDASTAMRSMLMLPHDQRVCIWALQVEKSEGRLLFGMCCHHGNVKLPPPRQLPQPLLDLLMERDPQGKEFLANARAYNSAFQLASHVYNDPDRGQRRSGFPGSFRIQGRRCHLIGPLLPDGDSPVFAQVYCSDPDYNAQVLRRMDVTGTKEAHLMRRLQDMLYQCNQLVQTFHSAARLNAPDLRLVLHESKGGALLL